MSVVLITGINSGIGQSLAKNLSKDFSIIGTLRSAEGKSADYCEELIPFYAGRSLELSRPVNTIIHTAGAHPRAANKPSLQDYIDSNVLMLDQLLKFGVAHGVKQLIYLSTDNLDKLDGLSDIYTASKNMGEALLKESNENMSLVSLRLPGVIGHEAPPRSFLSRSLEKIKKSEKVDIFNGDLPFHFIDHAEVVKVIRALMDQPPEAFTEFSLLNEEPLTLTEILEIMKKSTGSTSTISTQSTVDKGVFLGGARETQWSEFTSSKASEILSRFLLKI